MLYQKKQQGSPLKGIGKHLKIKTMCKQIKRFALSVLRHRNDHVVRHNKLYMKTAFCGKEKYNPD